MTLKNPKHEAIWPRKYYVYTLSDPRDGAIFYVGKGCNKRGEMHVKEWLAGKVVNAEKFKRIDAIMRAGHEPKITIIESGLEESAAYKRERKLIRSIGIENLTNMSPGAITGPERDKAWAQAKIGTIKPLEEWKKNPTSKEMKFYRKFVSEMEKLALGPLMPTSVTIVQRLPSLPQIK